MKQALVIVSFGTSVPQARESIAAIERALRECAPQREFVRAFTSPTIRKTLMSRGERVFGLEQALNELSEHGFADVIVQPTHLLYGIEYDKMLDVIAGFAGRIERLVLGKPLLADDLDLRHVAECMVTHHLPKDGALVLMGHGTAHFANMVYPALQTAFRLMGTDRVYVGTVEGWPCFDDILEQLRNSGMRSVRLVPLMLVAGDHVLNDMAGNGPDSWKSRLEAEGFTVSCHMEGLGVLPDIQEMYCARLGELLCEADEV